MSVGGGEVALGHAILLIGFLVSIVGALLTGITVSPAAPGRAVPGAGLAARPRPPARHRPSAPGQRRRAGDRRLLLGRADRAHRPRLGAARPVAGHASLAPAPDRPVDTEGRAPRRGPPLTRPSSSAHRAQAGRGGTRGDHRRDGRGERPGGAGAAGHGRDRRRVRGSWRGRSSRSTSLAVVGVPGARPAARLAGPRSGRGRHPLGRLRDVRGDGRAARSGSGRATPSAGSWPAPRCCSGWPPTGDIYAAWVMTTRGEPDALAVLGAWVQSWYWMLLLWLVFAVLPLVFPDGRLPSRRWRLPAAVGRRRRGRRRGVGHARPAP